MSALSDLLTVAIVRKGLSGRAVSRAARDLGYSLNHDTAARYLRGDHGQPDEETLVALSLVLDVPLRALREAADLPAESTEPYQPPREAARLNRRQRRAVDEIIRAMLDPSGSQANPGRRDEPSEVPRAARRGNEEQPD
jgi:transcriptional regulator with XRE-family HTH domain